MKIIFKEKSKWEKVLFSKVNFFNSCYCGVPLIGIIFFCYRASNSPEKANWKSRWKVFARAFLVFLLWFEWCYALKKLKILKNCDNYEKNSKFENHVVYCIRNFNCRFPGILMLGAYLIYMTCKQQKILYNISGCNLVSLIYVEDEIFSDWLEETNISLSNYRVIEFQRKQVTFCFVIALIISRVQVLEKCDYK